jgi:Cache domain
MAFDPLEIRISLQKFLTGLILIIVPLSVVGLYLTFESHTSLQQEIGMYFKGVAQTKAAATAQYVHDRLADVSAITLEPVVVDAVTTANHAYEPRNNAATTARIENLEKNWNKPAADSFVTDMLSSTTSRLLRRHHELDSRFLEIIVVDENGATVAATNKPLNYMQADQGYWQAVYAHGRGAVHITEVRYDEASKSFYVGIGAPILEANSGRFLGAVTTLVDMSGLFSFLSREQIGTTGRTVLVRDNGAIVSAPNVNPGMKLQSEEFAAVSDALGTLQGRQTGYVRTNIRNGNRIIGFADTGLRQSYPNLGWFIMISQDEQEALAPVRTVGRFALWMVVLGLLMLTMLAAYFFLHRKQELAQIEVMRPDDRHKGRATSA